MGLDSFITNVYPCFYNKCFKHEISFRNLKRPMNTSLQRCWMRLSNQPRCLWRPWGQSKYVQKFVCIYPFVKQAYLQEILFSPRLMSMKQKSKPICESEMVLHVKSEVKLAIPNVVRFFCTGFWFHFSKTSISNTLRSFQVYIYIFLNYSHHF